MELSMDKYYEFRSELKNLYKNDAITDDLACKVLEIRDKNRCINSVDISIQEGVISVEFDNEISEKKRKDITHKIAQSISSFINNNKDQINIDDDTFNYIVNNSYSYCDIYSVGDQVTFGLF